jgi:hypothetical protein
MFKVMRSLVTNKTQRMVETEENLKRPLIPGEIGLGSLQIIEMQVTGF